MAWDTATVGFNESFWLATSAAAPVITLAAVVALPDSSKASNAVASLWVEAEVRNQGAELRARLAELNEEASLSDVLKALHGSDAPRRKTDVRAVGPDGDVVRAKKLYRSAVLNQQISFGNVIIQAGLLAMSLAALAYHRDLVSPWVAIILAVGGILLLAWTLVTGAGIRDQWKKSN